MPSPGSGRRALELALRLTAAGLLAWALWLALRPAGPGAVEAADSRTLRAALTRWSTVTAPRRVVLGFDAPPPAAERDWLAALAAAGTTVHWAAPPLLPTAVTLEPTPDPAGGLVLRAAAPPGARLALGDTLGPRETLVAGAEPVGFTLAWLEEGVHVAVGPVRAVAAAPDSLGLRRLLVLGRAGWQARFVLAALAERGWTVDARLVVAPGADVYRGITAPAGDTAVAAPPIGPLVAPPRRVEEPGPGLGGPPRAPRFAPAAPAAQAPEPPLRLPVDTARYSAVLALDSSAARLAPALSRYLRAGGGLVLWPEAAAHRAFTSVAAAGAGAALPPEDEEFGDSLPRRALALAPLQPLAAEAVVLESRGREVAVAARRVGLGRVVQVGYLDDWRWRMRGPEGSVDRHREWLAGLVGAAARTAVYPPAVRGGDPAPLAQLVDRLGPPEDGGLPTAPGRPGMPLWLPFAIGTLLLLEWALRRLRGAA